MVSIKRNFEGGSLNVATLWNRCQNTPKDDPPKKQKQKPRRHPDVSPPSSRAEKFSQGKNKELFNKKQKELF